MDALATAWDKLFPIPSRHLGQANVAPWDLRTWYSILVWPSGYCHPTAIHWDDAGRLMGPNIIGSAVIQHLAKTRPCMVLSGMTLDDSWDLVSLEVL